MEDIRLTLEQCISPKEIMLKIRQLPEDTQIKVVTILWLWVLWNTCNGANAGEPLKVYTETFHLAVRYAQEFKTSEVQMYRPNVPWRATADGFLKINIDGAYSESHHTGGWGFCCPGHNLYYLKIEVGGRPSSPLSSASVESVSGYRQSKSRR